MVQRIFDWLANIFFFQMVAVVAILPPSWWLISYTLPRSLLQRYFKAPHFLPWELAVFKHYPGTLMRGGMFVTVIVLPNRGKKRQMADVVDYTPRWYRISSYVFFYVIFLLLWGTWAVLFFILLALLPFVD